MWQRFKRLLRSIFGFMISSAEDPELILQQNIRDMNDQVPKLNQNVAMVAANVKLLEKELAKLNKEEQDLSAKIQAALKAGRRDIALNFATTLDTIKKSKADTEEQLKSAKAAYEKALEIKKSFMAEKDRKTKEALAAIQAHRRAKWQAKVADVFQSFEVGGVDQTHDEMIRKIEEEAAMNEAKLDAAVSSVDTDMAKIEKDAALIRGEEILQQFESQLGTAPQSQETTKKELGQKQKV